MGSPGIFECTVLKALRSESSQKRTPCIAVQASVEFLDGQEPVWGNIYLTQATIGTAERPGMAVHQLRAIGYKGRLAEAYKDPTVLVGGQGKCIVEETQRGLRIASFGIPRSVGVVVDELKRLEAIDAAAPSVANFDRQLEEDRAAADGLKKNPNPTPPGVDADGAPEDDLPF
jgi:hypothetical protein